jgi:hypothetical protein
MYFPSANLVPNTIGTQRQSQKLDSFIGDRRSGRLLGGAAHMSRHIILASFAHEEDLLAAVRGAQHRRWEIADIYAPYPIHGLGEALGWPRSRLPVVCFLCGALGVALALWFQFWTTAWDWPLNVGGRPWNSLPAFVPVVFESMVLMAGFGLAFAWLFRCQLYPGKKAMLPLDSLTDDHFAVVLRDPGSATAVGDIRQFLLDCQALCLEERDGE